MPRLGLITGWGNGYVALPFGHVYHGCDYDFINQDIDVHGGLTFSEQVTQKFIDAWPELDQDDEGTWLIGFDTGHYGDTLENWSKEEVEKETERLLDQLTNEKSLKQLIDNLKIEE